VSADAAGPSSAKRTFECPTWNVPDGIPLSKKGSPGWSFLSRRARADYAVFGFFGISTTLLPNTSPKSFVTARSAASAT
jgi:hypothetical protein